MLFKFYYCSNNSREARNRAEKHRRDKLNYSIQELSTMVTHVADSPRRVDKTAVLRFSAHGLRIEYGKRYFTNIENQIKINLAVATQNDIIEHIDGDINGAHRLICICILFSFSV